MELTHTASTSDLENGLQPDLASASTINGHVQLHDRAMRTEAVVLCKPNGVLVQRSSRFYSAIVGTVHALTYLVREPVTHTHSSMNAQRRLKPNKHRNIPNYDHSRARYYQRPPYAAQHSFTEDLRRSGAKIL